MRTITAVPPVLAVVLDPEPYDRAAELVAALVVVVLLLLEP
jgi:hypothetical protein